MLGLAWRICEMNQVSTGDGICLGTPGAKSTKRRALIEITNEQLASLLNLDDGVEIYWVNRGVDHNPGDSTLIALHGISERIPQCPEAQVFELVSLESVQRDG